MGLLAAAARGEAQVSDAARAPHSARAAVTVEQITALLRQRLSDAEVARRLGCDRHRVGQVRRALGLPPVPLQPLTLEQKWGARTRPVEGGHLEWTGERQSTSGTPVLRYREKAYTAARIAFRIRYGREPVGYCAAECGRQHCVAPDHVEDEPGRARVREQLRYLEGRRQRANWCVQGHDQSEHGKWSPDGGAYCGACARERRRSGKAAGDGGGSAR